MERIIVEVERPKVLADGASVKSLDIFHPGEEISRAHRHGRHKGNVVVETVTGPMGFSAIARCTDPHCHVEVLLEAVPQR